MGHLRGAARGRLPGTGLSARPLLSIVTVCRNSLTTLQRTVASVLAFPERRTADRDALLAQELGFYLQRGHHPGA